jgi:biotin carboxyl carrier protein
MAKRIYLDAGESTWTAMVSGGEVRLSPHDAVVHVSPADDGFEATSGPDVVRGAAAVHADEVWVQINGEVFVFRLAESARRPRTSARDHDALTPPMPATVVRIAVTPGQAVRTGDLLIALEAMKMELPVRAPRDAVVRAVHCSAGELVQPGHILLDLE